MAVDDHSERRAVQLRSVSTHDPLSVLGQRFWPCYYRTVHEDGTVTFTPLEPRR